MDRNNKPLKWILLIVIIITIIFSIKFFSHKKEVSSLLKEKDITQVYNTEDANYTTKIKEENKNDNNKEKNKIIKSSESVNKKVKSGKDFISTNEAINNKNNNVIDVSKQFNVSNFNYDNKDFNLLSRLIYSEAGNEPYLGKIAVGNVVLYRAKQNNQTIEQVIFSRNQFDGINTNNFNIEPNQESKRAALEVLEGNRIIKDGYFFANLNLCSPGWAKEKTFICRIGDHWFFRRE